MPFHVTTPTRSRKTGATTQKTGKTTTRTRTRKRRAVAPEPAAVEATPVDELAAPVVEAVIEPVAESVIVTGAPEPGFAARVPPPEPPPARPARRRGVFFDVENTSRAGDISRVLDHLALDWVGWSTEFTAVGNWRVIGHDTARLLAHHGAALVHSAPSVGVRDWSDLRIAVSAGVWLAGARPGDVIEIVSDDQAFDAVGDVAASLGVTFHRTSYRALAGRQVVAVPAAPAGELRSRQRRHVSIAPNSTISIRIGFGNATVSPSSAAKPANHIQGDSAAIARPPSSGTTGSMLKRLRKNPVNASA